MGADGAATLGSMEEPTIRQPTPKLCIIKKSLILGVSGPIGLAQRFAGRIEKLWAEDRSLTGQKPWQAMTTIRGALWEILGPELQVADVAKRALGQGAIRSAYSTSLLAVPVAKKTCLFQFDQQGAPEEATENIPFVSIGSAQKIADPFLAFLRDVFWSEKLPGVGDGVFATVWTLLHAVRTNPGGVAEPIEVGVLRCKDQTFEATILSDEEMDEHRQAVRKAEKHLQTFPASLQEQPEEEPADTPPPEPEKC